ncbi:type II secretion system F family protein [Massilia sp. UMI-21]|nr:type II secretion system F family protein [Massilia sp. UMI-21]
MESNSITIITVVIAVSVAMLAWFAVEVGTNAMAAYKTKFSERAQFRAQEFFVFIDGRLLFLSNIAIMALGGIIAWLMSGSIVLAIPVFLAMGLFPRWLFQWMRMRRRRHFEEQLPDALLMLSGGLKAGASLSSAIAQLVAEAPAPLGQEFSLMLREQKLGVTLEQSLNNLHRRMPTQTTVLVVSAMRIANETGGGLAETLERTSNTIRSRLQMEGKISALTAQGKLQAWVVGFLPIVLLLVLQKMEPEAMALLWTTRIGWGALVALVFLEFMGIFVIRKIIAIDV